MMHLYIVSEAPIQNKYQSLLLHPKKGGGGGGGKEEEWTSYQNTASCM